MPTKPLTLLVTRNWCGGVRPSSTWFNDCSDFIKHFTKSSTTLSSPSLSWPWSYYQLSSSSSWPWSSKYSPEAWSRAAYPSIPIIIVNIIFTIIIIIIIIVIIIIINDIIITVKVLLAVWSRATYPSIPSRWILSTLPADEAAIQQTQNWKYFHILFFILRWLFGSK